MTFKITWRTHMACMAIALVISLMLDKLIDGIVIGMFESDSLSFPTLSPGMNFIILIFILMVPVSIVHELIHGAVFKAFKGRVRFGFKGIYAYCMEVSRRPIRRTDFLLVLLSPMVIITLISLWIGGWIGSLTFLLNILGSSGDIYMAFSLMKYGDKCKIVDREYGYDVVR